MLRINDFSSHKADCICKIKKVHLNIFLILILTSCTKAQVDVKEIKYKEHYGTNSEITLSSYLYKDKNNNSKYFIGKLISNNTPSTFFLDAGESNLAYVLRDSLFLTPEGLEKIKILQRLDLTIKNKLDSVIKIKKITVLLDMFFNNKVIAHRGAWKKNGLPQNSLASLNHTFQLGCEASEFDVHMTLDKILVINHDLNFGNMPIASSTYAQLFSQKLSNGESLPTLNEYLKEAMKQQKTKLFLEIKPDNFEVVDSVINTVHRLKAQAWVTYINFSANALKRTLLKDRGAKTLLLQNILSIPNVKTAGFEGINYNSNDYIKNDKLIAEAQNVNLHVGAWTIDDKATMQMLLTKNINSITTDEPEILLEIIK